MDSKREHEQTGGIAGLGAGFMAGAAIGAPLGPIGSIAGAFLGGLVGSEVGKTVGGTLLEVFEEPSVVPPPDISQPADNQHRAGTDVLAQLERLGQMKAQGLLTEEEFQAAKTRVLQQ